MKATDYLDKWYAMLIEADDKKQNEILATIISEFGLELIDMAEQRKAKKDKAFASLFKEQNQKYNKFCGLVNERCGVHFLKEDGLKKYWIRQNPQLENLIG